MEPGLEAEGWRLRCSLALALVACLAQTAVALLDALQPGPLSPLAWESTFGALFCAGLVAALLSGRVSLQSLEVAVTWIVSAALAAQLLQSAALPAPVAPRLYFVGLFVILCAVQTFAVRPALVWTFVILAAFSALALTRPPPTDTTLLLEMGVAVALVWQLAIFGRQVTRERVQRQEYHVLALTDPLTGVANRRAMYRHLEGTQGTGRTFAVVLLDLDHFKAINDRHGHAVGDRVLQRAAQVLRRALEPGDHVARWGGEEFLVLLPGADEARAAQVAARLWRALRHASGEDLPPFTASLGVAVAGPGDALSGVLQRADAHLYRAKAQGRDRWSLETVPAL